LAARRRSIEAMSAFERAEAAAEPPVAILLVDDNAAKRLALKAVLTPLGHPIVEADSGLGALRCVMAQDFAVILLDVCMPTMDGFETAALIRKRVQSEMTPIIFITAFGRDEIVNADLYAEGAVDFIFAPVPPNELRAKVSVFANLFTRAQGLATRAREIEGLNHELTAIARRDSLTGLGNRRALQEDLDTLEARAERYGHRYCVAMLDVDHFKAYNDAYGHQAGDRVLVEVAGLLRAEERGGDGLYRFGGDEFLCIFPEQSLASGTRAVRRMQTGLQGRAIPHAGSPFGVLTFSAGLAVLDPDQSRPASEILKEADDALYQGKQLGRDRVSHVGTDDGAEEPALPESRETMAVSD
jgi:diguanylate cyclase (GGDEF)-like protein